MLTADTTTTQTAPANCVIISNKLHAGASLAGKEAE